MVIFHSYVSLPKGSSFFFHSFFSRFPQNKFINDAGDQPESSTHPAFFRSCECCSSTKRAEYGRMNQFSQFSFGPLGRRSCLSRNILLSYTIIIYLYITSIMNYHIYIIYTKIFLPIMFEYVWTKFGHCDCEDPYIETCDSQQRRDRRDPGWRWLKFLDLPAQHRLSAHPALP